MLQVKSRKVNSTKSALTAALFNAVKIILQFVFRSVFIHYLSVGYLGVNSAVAGVLNFLSVTELGISSAITFNLYKPVAENDINKINAILKLYKKFYMIIGFIVLALGLALVPFLDKLITGVEELNVNIYFVYLLSLIVTVISYFASYRFVLFTAYQEQYKSNFVNMIITFVTLVLQILTIILFKNFYAYLIVQAVVSVYGIIITHIYTKIIYKEVNLYAPEPLDAETRRSINKNVKGMVYHKLSYSVLQGTDSVIISAFVGTILLGVYSNYSLFTVNIIAIFSLLTSSLAGSIGNLVAEGNNEKTYTIFKNLRFAFFWIAGFCSICLFVLLNPAIELWATLGKWGSSINWSFDILTVFIIVFNFYLYTSRIITGAFREAVGNFDKDRFKGVVEAAINVVASLILVKFMGIAGVLLGTIISCVCTSLWVDPYMLNKYHLKKSLWKHFAVIGLYTLVTFFAGAVTYFIALLLPSTGLWPFVGKLAICLVVPNVIYLVLYFKTAEFKNLFKLVKNLFGKLTNRKNDIKIEQKEQEEVAEIAEESNNNELKIEE